MRVTSFTSQEGDHYNYTNSKIKNIEYHIPAGEGDAHYCDVHFYGDKATVTRFFAPREISFEIEEASNE